MIGPEQERSHAGAGGAASDSVTLAWGDAERGLFGSLRVGESDGGRSAVALLFADGRLAASAFRSEEATTEVEDPLRAWTTRWPDDAAGWNLRFEALCAPLDFGHGTPAADAAGLEGYEQLCRVRGQVTVDGRTTEIDCLGQRGHQWGDPDWRRIGLARTVSAWLGPDRALTLAAVRPANRDTHAEEAVSAWLILPGEDEPYSERVGEPRLSTTYDGEGRQLRAGLELWPEGDDAYPRRLAGEAICSTSLDLGRVRLDTAFFSWRMDGERGVGRYDVLRQSA